MNLATRCSKIVGGGFYCWEEKIDRAAVAVLYTHASVVTTVIQHKVESIIVEL